MSRRINAALVLCVFLTGCGASEKPNNVAAPDVPPKVEAGSRLIDQLAQVDSLSWIKTLSGLYPEEYQRLGDYIAANAGSQTDVVEARLAIMPQVLPFMAARKVSIRSASDAALVEYLKRNAKVLELLLAENPTACVEVAQGRLNPAAELSEAAWTAMSEATSQLLIAAKAAEKTPVARPNLILDPDEKRSWMVEVGNAGATHRTAQLLTDPAAAATATPTELCQVRIMLMRGAILAPPPLAAKVVLAAG